MLKLIPNGEEAREECGLDEIARQGARRMIAEALELEVEQYILASRELRDELGHALVVKNGHARSRKLLLGCGEVEIKAPRVHDRREGHRFSSLILPPYMRKSPKISEVLPILYLKGLSTGDFSEALESLVGSDAKGLSANSIVRLKSKWLEEYRQWKKRSLKDSKYAYIWADGVNVSLRLGDDSKLCLLVIIGARADGVKELLAVEDGYRESKESWASLLRDLKKRGMSAPLLAVGDGALGFWAAIREVWPETGEQRCFVHKIANVLDKLPKRLQPKAKEALHEIMSAPTRDLAFTEMESFRREYEAKYPKASECLLKDAEALTAFYDFPANHWVHLRTTNPIESAFATVKLRTKKTKGAGSRDTALTMAFKLLASAEKRWRALNGRDLVQRVIAGAVFKDGIEQVQEVDVEEERVVA